MYLRTFAKPETSDIDAPSDPTNGVTATAADRMRFEAPSWLRSVCRKVRKFALSSGDRVLQPIPW